MNIQYTVLGYASTNTYYLSIDDEMLIVDPCLDAGYDMKRLLKKTEGYKVIGILLTHGHFDHISGVDKCVELFDCPFYMYHEELHYLTDMKYNLSNQTPDPFVVKSKPIAIDLEPISIGPFEFDVIKTPGHTSGSVSYIFDDGAIVGDFIFKGSIGRTDLPTGNMNQMNASIVEFVEDFGSLDLKLYPGHGEPTDLQTEIQSNPFIKSNL